MNERYALMGEDTRFSIAEILAVLMRLPEDCRLEALAFAIRAALDSQLVRHR